jgi:ferredoxin
MRVEVDYQRCEGHAVCVGLEPDVFELNDDDQAVVKTDPIPADKEDTAQEAVEQCPAAALLRRD